MKSNIYTVTFERHHDKKWSRYRDYLFAKHEMAVALAGVELPKAALSYPIAFMEAGGDFVPVALLGLLSKRNVFVSESGSWLGGYIPARLRAYPFSLVRNGDEFLLCVDEGSGLVSNGRSKDECAFFKQEGIPSSEMQELIDFLTEVEKSSHSTKIACAEIAKHGLFVKWPVAIDDGSGTKVLDGLYQINEQLFNQLPDNRFIEIRNKGALPIIYSQLLSMGQIDFLKRQSESEKVTTSYNFLSDSGTISFGGLQ